MLVMDPHKEIVIEYVLDSAKKYGSMFEDTFIFEQFYHEWRTDQYHAIVRATAKGKTHMLDLVQSEEQGVDGVWSIQTITDVPHL